MADHAYGGLGVEGGGQYYAMSPDQRRNLGADPNGATTDYSALSRQMRTPGLGSQAEMLEMYRQQALGQGPPSSAQRQLEATGQMQQRMASSVGAHSGDISGAMGMRAGAAAQQGQQQQLLRAQQMQQGLAGYAGLGTQMQQQGFGYDQLNQQQLQGANGMRTDWYLGAQGLNQQQQAANKAFNMGLYQAGAGTVGNILGAGASM